MQPLETSWGGRASANKRLREQRTALPEHVGVLRAAVVRFAHARGASGRECEQIALAVSEALTNSVLHAYVGSDEPGPVTVEAWVVDGSLTVVVCDEGGGMLPRLDSPGLGIGLPLIAQMSDRLDIEDRDGHPGVCVRMTFALSPA
jgi:serine/threonine-protein kinase RsbW